MSQEILEIPEYLVRPDDSHIFERDPENGCYRSYLTRDVTDREGRRAPAQEHFTLENLTERYGFFQITSDQIPEYEQLNRAYNQSFKTTSGHGEID